MSTFKYRAQCQREPSAIYMTCVLISTSPMVSTVFMKVVQDYTRARGVSLIFSQGAIIFPALP
jgi:hypothetical protein